MGATPDQLEREIVEVRADLARTITEIEARVHPRRLLHDHLRAVIGVGVVVGSLLALKVIRHRHG